MALKNVVLRIAVSVLIILAVSVNGLNSAKAESGVIPSNTVLLDFYGSQCPPCRAMRPVIEQLKQAGYPVKSVNVNENPVMAQKYGIDSIPCFIMISDGKVVSRTVGATSASNLAGICQQGINNALFAQRQRNRNGAIDGLRAQNYDVLADNQRARNNPPRLLSTGTSAASGEGIAIPPSVKAGNRSQAVQMASDRSNASNLSPERLLASAVRIRVKTSHFYEHGTGTIIDARNNRALILTCGHIFRDYAKENGGKIEIDMFGQSPLQNVEAKYICHDEESDLALVCIPLTHPIQTIPVAPMDYQARRGSAVASVGCDNGRAPTVQPGQIVAINRCTGPANIDASGSSVQGRSGGGLFSKEGYLIGVTMANVPGENQAFYSSYPAIHQLLNRYNLTVVITSPANDSWKLSEERLVSMPKEMPRPETVVELTGMPVKSNSPSAQSPASAPVQLASVTENVPLPAEKTMVPQTQEAESRSVIPAAFTSNEFTVRPTTSAWPPKF